MASGPGPSKTKQDASETLARRGHPENWVNPRPRNIYDLAIAGAGPAGIAAAEYAARHGFSVALVERGRIGGNSLNAGSVPSKALIRTARAYAAPERAAMFGVPAPSEPPLDYDLVLAHLRAIRARIAAYHSVHELMLVGVDVFFGEARFERGDALSVENERLRFKKALIATGAHPMPAQIPGLETIGYRTSDTIFDMPTLPRRLAVVGGGPLGCELAQAFCRLGPKVTIVQNEPKFLPREERDAAEILSRAMARGGVEIRLNTTVISARKSGEAKILRTVNDEAKDEIEADEVLLSVGRAPTLEGLGLAAAGVEASNDAGVEVDDFLRTANHNIYAAGDVCMALKFTNAARATARMAVRNALMSGEERQSRLIIPWCTYCDPEIAHVGMQVWEARQKSIPVTSYTVMLQDVDRAITDAQDVGFVKIHVEDGTDKILGATIVASRGSELVNEMSVAMCAGVGMKDLARVVHAYPAQSEAIMLAAQAFVRDPRTGQT